MNERFGGDPARFFDAVYEGVAPWDIGAPQPSLIELFELFPLQSPVLDIGSGSGDLAIWIAQDGYDVLGIDFNKAAVVESRARARKLSGDIAQRLRFEVGDASRPSRFGRDFGSVVDSGFYHLFEEADCVRLADEFHRTLRPGGRYYILAFAVELPSPDVPRQVTEEELRHIFSLDEGWALLHISSATFVSRVGDVPAIRACFERRRFTPSGWRAFESTLSPKANS